MKLGGIVSEIEKLAARSLPKDLVVKLQAVKQRLPLRLQLAGPVLQAYVNDGETRSYLGLHNFYSVLLPDVRTEAIATLQFRGPDGEVVLRHRLHIEERGSAMVDVAALFAQHGVLATLGVVSVQLTPRWPRRKAYRALGRVTAHFFVHFESESGSVGQIHPLSVADPANVASGPFTSSQLISTRGLVALEAIQYNATPVLHRLEHRLSDPQTGRVLMTRALSLAPLGAGITRFEMAGLDAPAQLAFSVDDLPSHNAKPVLRRVFENGLYSTSHA